jgi:hypothetical protein
MFHDDFLIGLVLGLVVGITVIGIVSNAVWRSDLVTRGLAIYCPLDGNFAFIGECDK